jgi:NAD(P)-dependent dehydrogenase (short-subunit alcohol dehydrogenase family)
MTEYEETTPSYAGLQRMDGRHVLVLGAGQGIGRQTALALAQLGAKVSVVDNDAVRAEQVAAETGGIALVGDITSWADVERIFAAAIAEHGTVRGIADIVGVAGWGPLRDMDEAAWQRGLDLNLKHAFFALQAGAAAMAEGGSIVFVASVSGIRSSPNHAAYGAAKAGLRNLVTTASLELSPGIRVNAVAPGQTITPRMIVRHAGEEGYYESRARLVPLGRIGQPSDIAAALVFFLSDQSAWITGQTLVVDGGTTNKFPYDV